MSFKFNPLTGVFDLSGGGGGVVFGDPEAGFTAGMIQYISQANTQFGDDIFTRSSGVQKQTELYSRTFAQAGDNTTGGEFIIQANNFGSNPTITFDGVLDTDANVLAYNIANPSNTISVLSGGSNIPLADTYTLAGGGPAGFTSGLVGLPTLSTFIQGTGIIANDLSTGDQAVNIVGNLAPTGASSLGALNGFVSSTGISLLIAEKDNASFTVSDFVTYNSAIRANNGNASITFNSNEVSVDAVGVKLSLGSDSIVFQNPLTVPNINDVLTVTNISGTDYIVDFAPGGGLSPALTQSQFFVGGSSNLAVDAGPGLRYDTVSRYFIVTAVDNAGALFVVDGTNRFVGYGDLNGVVSGVKSEIYSSTHVLSGALPVAASQASIVFTGGGLNDISLSGTWTGADNSNYTATITHNNKKYIRAINFTLPPTVGDTIAHGAFPAQTAVIEVIEDIGGGIYNIVADQSGGAWSPVPATIIITIGVNVGATASIAEFADISDIYSLTGNQNNQIESCVYPLNIRGAVLGWGAVTGHSIGDFWVIGFTAVTMSTTYNYAAGTINIGNVTGYNQPKSIQITQSPVGSPVIKIGNVQGSKNVLALGQNQIDGLMFYNQTSSARYLNIDPVGASYGIGDLSAGNNQTFISLDDADESIALQAKALISIGDVLNLQNSTLLSVADTNQVIESSVGGSSVKITVNDLENHKGVVISKWTNMGNSTPYAVLASDYILSPGAASIGITVNLPAALSVPDGKVYIIKDEFGMVPVGGGILLDADGTNTIDGAPNYVFSNQYESITLVLNRATGNWRII